MAVFGLTVLHEDDALRAVRAAVEMRETLAHLNEDFEQRYGLTLATRTGISTGTVAGQGLVPDRNFVAGDTANTAARLQQTAEPGEILLAAPAYRLVREHVEAELLDRRSSRVSRCRSPRTGLSLWSRSQYWRLGWSRPSWAAKTRSPSSSGRSSERSPRTAAAS